MMVEASGLAQTDPGVLATSGMISDDHTEVTSKDPGLISRCVCVSVLEQRRFNISG